MEPEAGGDTLRVHHFKASKSLQPLLALVSYETDEEPVFSPWLLMNLIKMWQNLIDHEFISRFYYF